MVVVDIDKQGAAIVHNLHTVFPSVRIVAVTKYPAKVEKARRFGASAVILGGQATPQIVSSVVSSLLSRVYAARLPERLVARVRRAGEDEEQVGEPVQVDERERVQRALAGGVEHLALGAAARRSRDMQPRGGLAAAGKNEAAQLGQRLRSPRRSRPRAGRCTPE